MKKILSFILALVFSVSFLFGCGGKGESNTPESIEQLEMEKETVPTYLDSTAKNPFIIGLWCQVPQHKVEIDENGDRVGDAIAWTDEELLLNYQNVKESGINLTIVSVGNSDYVRHLNFIEEVGIYTIIDDAQFRNILFDQTITDEEAIRQSQELINRYKEYECFYGHHIVDEPGVTKFEDLKNAKLRYEKIFPDKLFRVNLYPVYASTGQLGTTSYKDYLEKYIDIIGLNYLCYDHYPLFENRDGSTRMQDSFLYNMSVAQAVANGTDVWTFLQSIGYANKKDPDCVEDIRIQSNSALAFGLKGIFWFIYWTIGRGAEAFTNACINWDGTKTHRYEYIKQAGSEIHSLWNVLDNFEWQRVMTFIGSENDNGGENSSFGFLQTDNTHQRIHKVKTTKDTFAGVFKDGEGRDGFMFVNYDAPTSKDVDKVDIQFKNCTQVIVYINGERKQVAVKNGAISLELKASDAAFIIPLYI